MKKENIIDIITDEDGRKIVVITDIRFKGKRNIDWEDVENYLKEYVGKCYEVVETADQVFIGNDFPEELKGSEDTKRLCGANAKTKANATQKIPTLLKCATNKRWQENFKGKTAYFGGLNNVKFKHKVVPGDRLRLECEIIKQKGPVGVGKATATVDGKIAVVGELTFMIG